MSSPLGTILPETAFSASDDFEEFFKHLELYTEMEDKPLVACDTETNAQEIRDGRGYLTGISLSFKFGVQWTMYLPFRHPEDNLSHKQKERVRYWFQRFADKGGWLIFHNAKFDLVSLKTAGIDYQGHFYDTMIICHLLDENLFSKKLEFCVRKYCPDIDGKKNTEAFNALIKYQGWGGISFINMREYAEQDAYITYRLFEARWADFCKEDLHAVWDHKQKFMRLLIKMESRGIKIDKEVSLHEAQRGTTRLEELTKELKINPNSGKDLERILINELKLPVIKRTKQGKPSFNKEAMEVYDQILERQDSDLAKKVKEYRGWSKTVGSNYRAYLRLISPDGRLRPNYKLHGTRTGRLSCEEPNLQQIPRSSSNDWNGKLKQAFIPEDGYELWEFDFSQLELRLGSAYAKEAKLKEIFADSNRDVFTEMSVDLGFSRQDTKTLVYSIQYGAGITRISAVFGVSDERARQIKAKYQATYPGFVKVENMAKAKCVSLGKIKLWSGRYRHFIDRRNDAHKAFNSVIQGGAADIMERQMLRMYEEFDNDDTCRMLLTVHDSVVWEIHKDCVEDLVPKIKALMADVMPDFQVKFAVDAKKWGVAA